MISKVGTQRPTAEINAKRVFSKPNVSQPIKLGSELTVANIHRILALSLLLLFELSVLGCADDSGPVTPSESPTTTSQEPTGAEPVLADEGP